MDQTSQPSPRHHLDIQVRFNDFDMFGHLNNNAYLEYCDLAKADYFAALLGGPVSPERLSMVVAGIEATFYEPTLPGEPLRVDTRLKHLGESSMTLEQGVVNPSTGALKAKARTVMVYFDVHTLKSKPIPDDLRALLQADK